MTINAPVQLPLPSSVDALRASLLDLINVCPVEECNPADCPLFALREMGHRERLHWFASLDRADVEYLAAYHYVCMKIKLGAHQLPAAPQPSVTPTKAN